jgi:hypothetical protein
MVTIDQYGTPTFLPQDLQVAGKAGPRKDARTLEIPGFSQCGHEILFIFYSSLHISFGNNIKFEIRGTAFFAESQPT